MWTKLRPNCLTFDLQNQLRVEGAADQTVLGDAPQLVVFAALRGDTKPSARHQHVTCGLQETVL